MLLGGVLPVIPFVADFARADTPIPPEAYLVPPVPILALYPETGITGDADGSNFEIENAGLGSTGPLRLVTQRITLTPETPTVEIPAAGKLAVQLRYPGPCASGTNAWACATGSVTITGPGGSYTVRIDVFPPDFAGVGMRPARTWWNPNGPLPPEPPARSWQTTGIKVATPSAIDTIETGFGPISIAYHIGAAAGGVENAAVATVIRAAMSKCTEIRTKPHSEYGEEGGVSLAWGADGKVSSMAYNSGSWDELFEPCLAMWIVGQPLPTTTKGSAMFTWATPKTT